MYFHLNIHTMVNLIQAAYQSPKNEDLPSDGGAAQNAATLIFFCTLNEALLENLLCELCRAKQLPTAVIARLLSDNSRVCDRQGKLWVALTEKSWKWSIEKAGADDTCDYVRVNKFCADMQVVRNKFVHRGASHIVSRTMAETCANEIWAVTSFYVALHNAVVHPLRIAELKAKGS